MQHVSLPHHFYVYVDNRLLGPGMPAGKTRALLHAVYGRPGEAVLTHLLLESGAHWSGIPLVLLTTGEAVPDDASSRQPWGCMGTDIHACRVEYLDGLRVVPRTIGHSGRHTGILIDWDGPFSRVPQEHKPLSLIHLDDGGFALLPNNYFTVHDAHFTTGDTRLCKMYKRGDRLYHEGSITMPGTKEEG